MMSIESTSRASLYRKKTMHPALSQSDDHPYSRHSLKTHQQRSHSMHRTASSTEEISGDILTDLSALPYMTHKPVNHKRNRRFSELKPSHAQQVQSNHSERRNSTSQINFTALLPNLFRSHKHTRNSSKDEINTATNIFNSTSSLHHNDAMTMKTELPLSMKLSNTALNNDRLVAFAQDDSRSSSISSGTSLFSVDISSPELRSAATLKLELHTSTCIAETYRENFFSYFHTNYCGEFEQEGPFIASLRYLHAKPTDETDGHCEARAIIRTSSRNDDVSVVVDSSNEDHILQLLFNQANLSVLHTCKTIGDPKANEKIYSFDKLNDERQNCKIGLIYQRSDQTAEFDIYSNDFLSIDLLDFLQILGDRVRLKGYTKYRGDLDVKDDLHGSYSYYTEYKNHEVMFNIAPIIPSTKANGQCIERKGLVGNAFVCIVFQEPNAEFSPDLISGKVTQIYITVQPHRVNEQVFYKVTIWHRSDFTRTIDPPGGMLQSDHSFRDYFLTLLLNSVHMAIESPSLRSRVAEQRQRLKREELRKLCQTLCVGQSFSIPTDLESINYQMDQRSSPRSDSILNSTVDSTVSTSARTKRGFSKFFGVFGGRQSSVSSSMPSPSTSLPPNFVSQDIVPLTPSSPDMSAIHNKAVPPASKEPIRRTTSAKGRPAPPPPPAPPIPPRIPIAKAASIPVAPSSGIVTSHILDLNVLLNESAPSPDTFLNTSALEEPTRNRSNSSPESSTAATTKHPSATISSIIEENDSVSSVVDEDFEHESSTTDTDEHRQTTNESESLSETMATP